MKFLDCFCGVGGASGGFHREGYDVTGIDIVKVGYPYFFIEGDMLKLDGKDFRGFDVIWGSPPCRDFTQLPDHWTHKDGKKGRWKIPKSPERGLKLVKCYLQFIEDAQPKIWIMENVPNLQNYLSIKPTMVSKIKRGMKRAFWGNFPYFLMSYESKARSENWDKGGNKLRSWIRAKIPLACSLAFAKACKEELSKGLK